MNQKMLVLNVRSLVNASTEELIEDLAGRFIIRFEDGEEMQTTDLEAIYSSFGWELYRAHPHAKVTSKAYIRNVANVMAANSNAHVPMFEKACWDIADQYEALGLPVDFDKIAQIIFDQNNNLYNYGAVALPGKAQTTDILDYRAVYQHPEVKAILAGLVPDQDVFKSSSKRLTEIVMNDESLANNQLIRSARTGLVRMHQFIQCLLVRGFVSDLDNMIFSEPAMGNYTLGYANPYSQAIDTRTTGVSLNSSAHLLRQTEYSSRKLQILDMTIERVYPGDCGSTEYFAWKLGGELVDGKAVGSHAHDFKNFVGKYFLDEDQGVVRPLGIDEEGKYLGKTLLFRDALAGCNHPDPNSICQVCFGKDAEVIPENTNLGHLVATAMMKILAQLILSTKHFAGSSSAASIVLNDYLGRFLRVTPDGGGYMLHKRPRGTKMLLAVNPEYIGDITILTKVKNVQHMAMEQISSIELMTFCQTAPGEELFTNDRVNVTFEKRRANFTYEALEYIRDNGWTRDDQGNYVFDFTDWDVNKPIMSLPKRFFNTADHAEAITSLIQGSSADKKKKKNENSGSLFYYFNEFYHMVNDRLQIRANILSTIMFGAAIVSYEEDDFRMPKGGVRGQLGSTLSTLPGRGVGAIIPFERHSKAFFTTQNYTDENLMDHCFDSLVMPVESLAHRAKRGLS